MALPIPSGLLSSPQFLKGSGHLKIRRQQHVGFASPASSWSVVGVKASVRTPTVRIVRHAEEEGPSAKELHQLRKKEEQKKHRKIRKEQREKRRAEELALLPRPKKPNPALKKFSKPLENWNKPRKNKRKPSSAAEAESETGPPSVLKTGDGKERNFPRESETEFQPLAEEIQGESSDVSMESWIDFEAVYKEKRKESAQSLANEDGSENLLHNSERAIAFANRTGPLSNDTQDASDGFKREHDESIGWRDSEISSISYRGGTQIQNAGNDDLSVVRGVNRSGEDELNTSVRSQTGGWEGSEARDVSADRNDQFRVGIERQSERAEWRRDSVSNGNTTRANDAQDDDSMGSRSEHSGRNGVYGDELEHDSGRRDVNRFSASSTSGGFIDQHTVLGKDRQIGPAGAASDAELSEFWDRRDMHLREKFDVESQREKFEATATKTSRNVKALSQEIARVVIGRRRGESVSLTLGDNDASPAKGLPREDLNEERQLEWLAKQLNSFARPDGVHLSRLMRSGDLKITDGRAVILVKRLGELGNWRCAMQVVEWLNSRNHYPPLRSRFVFTTLLSVLGKARRPVESLSVFNVMREQVATYPDMAAYHVVAVTLGQAGHMEELFNLIKSLRQGPAKKTKYLHMVADGGCLIADTVVYNAVLNSCVPHKQWRYALFILAELKRAKNLRPNSATYGLAIEVMVKAGKLDCAWEILEDMQLGGYHPNALTFKALVRGLGRMGKAHAAISLVRRMEERGIVAVFAVYYELARALCISGRWEDAVQEIDFALKISSRPAVESYTGLIRACQDAERLEDAISVYEHMQDVCAPNIGTYNIMISIYGAKNMYDEAKAIFEGVKTGRMVPLSLYKGNPRLSPDAFTFDAILGACTMCKRWEDFDLIFKQMQLQGFPMDSKRHSWIVRAISRAGKDRFVAAIFNHLKSQKAATSDIYVSMIESSVSSGGRNVAFGVLQEMIEKDLKISVQNLENLRDVAGLLCDEDKLTFTKKVDDLTVTSAFDFNKSRQPGRLQRRSTSRPSRKMASSLGVQYDSSRATPFNVKEKENWERGNAKVQASPQSLDSGVPPITKRTSEDRLTPHENQSHPVLSGSKSWELVGSISGIRS